MSERSAAVEGEGRAADRGDGVVVRPVVVAQKDLADRARGIKAHDDVIADILQREIRREPSAIGNLAGLFDWRLLQALPLRIFGLMDNDLLQAIPLFLYLGVVLERTRLARDLIESLGELFGKRPGGYAVATLSVGVLIAPTTGAVGATVLALGLLALPASGLGPPGCPFGGRSLRNDER